MSALPVLVVALAFFVAGAWVTAAVGYPLFNAAVARRPGLARVSLVVATVPVVVGAVLALAAFLPGEHLGPLLDCHCVAPIPGWQQLCPAHPTAIPSIFLPSAAVLGLLLPGRLRALLALAREPIGTGTGGEPALVDLPRPMAVLAGWWRPSLLIDRRLWASLGGAHREAVLAHERAHLARRDPLMLAVLRLLTGLGPREASHRLMRQWLDHAEHRADAAAASVVDPLTLAEALVACAHLTRGSTAIRLGWTAGRLDARVRALVDLQPGNHGARPDAGPGDLGLLAVAVFAGLASIPWLHHQVEHLLNLSL